MLQTANGRALSAGRSSQQRMVSFTIVAGLHVAVIAIFIMALRPNIIPFYTPGDITVTIPKPEPPQTVPQHPAGQPNMLTPTVPEIPLPVFTVKESTPPQITPPPGGEQGNAQALPTRSPVALFSTHTTPPYPPLERRLGFEGNVLLKLTVDADGEVADAVVVRSSGHDDLDRAAASWVKAHWRYLPALQNGLAIASTTNALVTFKLTSQQ